MFCKNYYEAAILAYQKISELPELYYNLRDFLFSRIITFNKISPKLVMNFLLTGI